MLFCGVASAVQTRRRMAVAAVSGVVRDADGRDGDVSDAAVRRQRLCRRNADRDGPDSRRAVFGVCCAVPAADRPDAFANASDPFFAYGDRDPPCDAHIPIGRFDRQRQSSQRTDHGAPGDPDRQDGRSTSFAGAVYQAVRHRSSLRGTAAIGYASRIRKYTGRLHLRTVAGADRKSAGDRTGMSFTV